MSGTIVNIDPNLAYFFMKSLDGNYENLEEKAKQCIEIYRNSGITDLLFCIFEQSSITRSQVMTTRGDKYNQTIENGITVDYAKEEKISLLHKMDELGVDLIELWLNHTRQMGIRPWITLRMNDIHFHSSETSFLRGDLFYEAREKGWFLGREKYGAFFSECLDYGVPEIRERMLAYIREQLNHYDCDGLELDFQREMTCFRFLDDPECHLIMNDFMTKVRAVTREMEVKWGHPIPVMVRLSRDLAHCKQVGFDVLFWAQHGLVDALVPAAHWITTDSDMPIAEWVKLLKPYGVQVYAGLEINVLKNGNTKTDLEIAKAHTVQYTHQGSEKIYLNNFFSKADKYVDGTPLEAIWRACADPDLAAKGIRRYVVTRQDDGFCNIGHPDAPKGWKPLPQDVSGEFSFEMKTGPVNPSDDAILFVGADGAYTVSVNGVPATALGSGDDAFVTRNPEIETGPITAFSIQLDGSCTQTVTVAAENATVRYLELKVDGK